jgi:O-antigen/teichoic acid export membrane protein
VVTLVVNLVLCIALIPAHSWRGAVAATAASECTYAVLLWTIAAVQLRRARLTPPSPPLHP